MQSVVMSKDSSKGTSKDSSKGTSKDSSSSSAESEEALQALLGLGKASVSSHDSNSSSNNNNSDSKGSEGHDREGRQRQKQKHPDAGVQHVMEEDSKNRNGSGSTVVSIDEGQLGKIAVQVSVSGNKRSFDRIDNEASAEADIEADKHDSKAIESEDRQQKKKKTRDTSSSSGSSSSSNNNRDRDSQGKDNNSNNNNNNNSNDKEESEDNTAVELAEAPAPKRKRMPGKHQKGMVPPGKQGVASYTDEDVLCGRGSASNLHIGNRTFRKIIDRHRAMYLRAKKNDKPLISREVVRTVRERGGRFLKQEEKSGLWFEIGDVLARDKVSQQMRHNAQQVREELDRKEQEEQMVRRRREMASMELQRQSQRRREEQSQAQVKAQAQAQIEAHAQARQQQQHAVLMAAAGTSALQRQLQQQQHLAIGGDAAAAGSAPPVVLMTANGPVVTSAAMAAQLLGGGGAGIGAGASAGLLRHHRLLHQHQSLLSLPSQYHHSLASVPGIGSIGDAVPSGVLSSASVHPLSSMGLQLGLPTGFSVSGGVLPTCIGGVALMRDPLTGSIVPAGPSAVGAADVGSGAGVPSRLL